jgi:hypothetical protein
LHRAEKSDYFIESQIIIDYDYYMEPSALVRWVVHVHRPSSAWATTTTTAAGSPDMHALSAIGGREAAPRDTITQLSVGVKLAVAWCRDRRPP